jgi:hypothetical protein
MTNSLRRVVAVVVIAGSCAALAACGSSGSGSSSTTTTPSTCTSLQKLQSSVDALKNVNIAQQGTDGVKAALDNVQQAAKDAKTAASDQFGSDLDALESAIQKFGDDLSSGRGSESITDYVSKLGDDVTAIGDAFDQLSTSAKNELKDCDLSKSSG